MKLKSIMMAVAISTTAVSLHSCGCSSDDSNYESSSGMNDDLSKFAGTWNCSFSTGDGMSQCITVRINQDGTGKVQITVSSGYGPSETLIKEDVSMRRDGDVIYMRFYNGTEGKIYIRNGELYTDDGKRYIRA